jgi:hypothetical protein
MVKTILLKPGAILTGEEMCSDEILLRSEFYLDFLRPLDVRYSIRAVLTSDPEPLSYFSAGRPHKSRPFGDVQRNALRALAKGVELDPVEVEARPPREHLVERLHGELHHPDAERLRHQSDLLTRTAP